MKRVGAAVMMACACASLFAFATPGCGKSSSDDAPATTAVVGPLVVERFTVDGTPATFVHVIVPVLSTRADLQYANIALDTNGDHVIQPTEWLEQNIALGVQPASYGFYLPLADLTVTSANITFVLSRGPIATTPSWNGAIPAGGVGRTMPVSFTMRAVVVPPVPPDGYVGAGAVRDDVPNTTQGERNTCVPHAIAASVGWLARKYKFACKLSYANWPTDGSIPDGGSLGVNAGIQEMATDVLSTYQDSGTFREDAGVNLESILAGKQRFVAEKGLPIVTTRIPADPSDVSGKGVFDGIAKAIDANCAVEAVVQVFHKEGSKAPQSYAHMVTVVGYEDTGADKSLSVNDSQNDAPAGDGLPDDKAVIADNHKVLGTRTDYWPPPPGSTDGNAYAQILFALQECPAPNADVCSHVTAPPPAKAPPVLGSFSSVFNQGCFCTTYTVSATDPGGAPLHYAWTSSNACGSFTGGDHATAVWNHPDSTMPGACPDEAVHPGNIVVVITGSGGSLTCTYGGGSGNGTNVQCVPGP